MTVNRSLVLLVVAIILFVIAALIAGAVISTSVSVWVFGFWGLVAFAGSFIP